MLLSRFLSVYRVADIFRTNKKARISAGFSVDSVTFK